MFKKYAAKISNSLGTINYVKKKSSNSKQDKDNNNNNNNNNRGMRDPTRTPKTTSLLALPTAQILISTAIKELRRTFFFYTLVF